MTTHPTDKQCIDCAHLQPRGDNIFKCEKFDDGEDAYPIDFATEKAVKEDGIDGCLNWTPKESAETEPSEAVEPSAEPRPEPSEAELSAARDRRDAKMRSVRFELRQMEDAAREARREANGYKKSIAELTLELDRIIETDPKGFLLMEEEERRNESRPLLDIAEDWRKLPVDEFDLPEKDREKLNAHWKTCGKVADWLSRDFIDKKEGCNRQDFRDRVRTAIDKISGAENAVQQELQNVDNKEAA